MMVEKTNRLLVVMISVLLLVCSAMRDYAQVKTTAFSYQGRLTDGRGAANGNFDMQFKLFDAITEGSQIGAAITNPTMPVSNGVFTVQLDFGGGASSSAGRFLEISVRPAGSASPYTKLSTREQIVSAPYAVQTLNVRQWGGGDANQEEYIQNSKTRQEEANFNISGDGTVGGTLLANTVGVGASKPTSKLTVETTKENYGLLHTDGNVEVGTWVGAGSSGADSGWFGTKSKHALRFFTADGPPRMTIDTAGNVGIGTTTPRYRLEVNSGTEEVAVFGQGVATGVQGNSSTGAGVVGNTKSGEGVVGLSTSGNGIRGETSAAHVNNISGVYGRSTGEGGIGVIGEANKGNAWGVFGTSKDGTGVRGESAAANTSTNPGVYGRSTGEGGVGVTGEANNGNADGVLGKSDNGVGVYGRSARGRAMYAEGDAGQARDKGGWVKAMALIKSDATIARCYNGITGSSSGNCGFSVQYTGFEYDVDFGFQVEDRFISVTPSSSVGHIGSNAHVSRTKVFIEIFYSDTRGRDGREGNTLADFFIIVF